MIEIATRTHTVRIHEPEALARRERLRPYRRAQRAHRAPLPFPFPRVGARNCWRGRFWHISQAIPVAYIDVWILDAITYQDPSTGDVFSILLERPDR